MSSKDFLENIKNRSFLNEEDPLSSTFSLIHLSLVLSFYIFVYMNTYLDIWTYKNMLYINIIYYIFTYKYIYIFIYVCNICIYLKATIVNVNVFHYLFSHFINGKRNYGSDCKGCKILILMNNKSHLNNFYVYKQRTWKK